MCISVSNLYFPQMKLASEKPPEAVLEGVIFKNFLGEHAHRPPYIMVCFARHPSSLLPMAWCNMQHICSSAQDVKLLPGSVVPVVI